MLWGGKSQRGGFYSGVEELSHLDTINDLDRVNWLIFLHKKLNHLQQGVIQNTRATSYVLTRALFRNFFQKRSHKYLSTNYIKSIFKVLQEDTLLYFSKNKANLPSTCITLNGEPTIKIFVAWFWAKFKKLGSKNVFC